MFPEDHLVAKIEVYELDEMKPLFVGEFAFCPRFGETITKEMGGYFNYYKVVEVWHREEGGGGIFQTCMRVVLDD